MYDTISDSASDFLIITFLFMVGSMFGWTLELFFRRFLSSKNPERRWINPGFLTGPALPLYGFGLLGLFIMSILPYVGIDYYNDAPGLVRTIVIILAMGVMMTLIEYIAGIIFIKHLKVKLWDYSDEWGNVKGIICPKFSVIWTLLGALYYFFVQPLVIKMVIWFDDNIAFTFVVGMFYGIFIIDLCYSLNIVGKLRSFAKENDIVIMYETLKQEIRNDTEKFKKRGRFLLAFNPHEQGLLAKLEESIDEIKALDIRRIKNKKPEE